MALRSRNDITLCFVFLLLAIIPCLSAERLDLVAGLYDSDYHDPHTSPPGGPPSDTRLSDLDYHDLHTSPPGGPLANTAPRMSNGLKPGNAANAKPNPHHVTEVHG